MIALILIIGLLFPSEAFAWAPGTHLFYAQETLQFAYLLPVALQQLLTTHKLDFYYGCIAADITLGKAYVEYLHNCHNFDVGMNLLNHAKTPHEKAFVYGYLSHLAADTVSHNFFVPYQNVEHFETAGKFRHAYWEVRLDQYFHHVWEGVDEIIRNPHNHGHDQLLDGALKETIFSFRTNKVLFSSMLSIQRLKKWQTFVRGINRLSSLQFNGHHVAEYNKLAVSAIIRFLSEGKDSVVYKVDPTGHETIDEATALRGKLKRLKKAGKLTHEEFESTCKGFRQRIRERYFSAYPIEDPNFHPSIHTRKLA